jgi:serine/threonine protein kinase
MLVNEDAKFVMAELVTAIEYLQGCGATPAKLALENLFLTSAGHLKLDPSECTKASAGANAATIWTLGVLLHELLTGITPFYSSDVQQLYR